MSFQGHRSRLAYKRGGLSRALRSSFFWLTYLEASFALMVQCVAFYSRSLLHGDGKSYIKASGGSSCVCNDSPQCLGNCGITARFLTFACSVCSCVMFLYSMSFGLQGNVTSVTE
jgi:hypothetical protein